MGLFDFLKRKPGLVSSSTGPTGPLSTMQPGRMVAALDCGSGDYNVEVVGESHRQDALKWALRNADGRVRGHPIVRVLLEHEPTNPADPNAIKIVNTAGDMMGYLPRETAAQYASIFASFQRTGRFAACMGQLHGGTADKPSIGIWLDLKPVDQFDEYIELAMVQQPWVSLMQESRCPYCEVDLQPRPKAKKKCPSCGSYIYARSRTIGSQRFSFLVTEEQVKAIEDWHAQQSYGYPR